LSVLNFLFSVPGYHLLLQHQKLHLSPNPNLLSVQSITNLMELPKIPSDIAAASSIDPEYGGQDQSLKELPQLYENSAEFTEPKKLFQCDRCPYSNPRRDMLLSHLKFHLLKSELKCPYCDYSVSKQHLLNQHIKIHFNLPGSDMNSEPGGSSSPPVPQLDVAEDEAADLRAAYAEDPEEVINLSTDEPDKVECKYCGREFKDEALMMQHMKLHQMSIPSKQ
jgi:hypothetical protein